MQLLESLKSLNDITGYANMVKEPLQGVNGVENFLHIHIIQYYYQILTLLYLDLITIHLYHFSM